MVSNDREVMRAAARAGAVVITVDEFLARIERLVRQAARPTDDADPTGEDGGEEGGDDDGEDAPRGPKKGNPRKLSKKRRAAERALGRLRSSP